MYKSNEIDNYTPIVAFKDKLKAEEFSNSQMISACHGYLSYFIKEVELREI